METVKIYLRRMRINRGGYTDKGQYFGIGLPLYCASFEYGSNGYVDETIRATDRYDAKQIVLAKFKLHYPQFTFKFAR